MQKFKVLAIVVTLPLLVLANVQSASVSAMVIKPHLTVDDEEHVTGHADECSVMGATGTLMYNDAKNDNIHDHDYEHVLCVPLM